MLSYSPLGFHICMCMYMLVTFLLFESNQNKYKNFWDKEKRRNFYFEYDLLLLWIIWLVSSGFNGFVIVKISFQIKANQFFFIFLCPFPCYDQITNQKRMWKVKDFLCFFFFFPISSIFYSYSYDWPRSYFNMWTVSVSFIIE